MAMNELTKKRVQLLLDNYCENKIPAHLRNQVKVSYEIRGNNVTLYEERPYYKDPPKWRKSVVAQFRYNPEEKKWAIYWERHTGKWYKYEEAETSLNLEVLIKIMDEDKFGVFWG